MEVFVFLNICVLYVLYTCNSFNLRSQQHGTGTYHRGEIKNTRTYTDPIFLTCCVCTSAYHCSVVICVLPRYIV